MPKRRLDLLLVLRGLCPSRERARASIMAGLVLVNGRPVTKPGEMVEEGAELVLRGEACPYVSRGGLKLEWALDAFRVSVEGRVALDVGAATGGFTDCLLRRGAKLVYAVDVGYGQLAWKLRQDPRVVVKERTNIRYLQARDLPLPPTLAVIDASFISLEKFLGHVLTLLSPPREVVALVKPQFEAGREQVGKKGVVRDPAVHRQVLQKVVALAEREGCTVQGLTYSPLLGPEGNIEFFLHLAAPGEGPEGCPGPDLEERIAAVVAEAHARLRRGGGGKGVPSEK
ncbi:MAG: TlyA family RNA methyltransferase [Bacillota bacterium]|nr:TlyA family RNA methyltransferase [Bacillota bacterium]